MLILPDRPRFVHTDGFYQHVHLCAACHERSLLPRQRRYWTWVDPARPLRPEKRQKRGRDRRR